METYDEFSGDTATLTDRTRQSLTLGETLSSDMLAAKYDFARENNIPPPAVMAADNRMIKYPVDLAMMSDAAKEFIAHDPYRGAVYNNRDAGERVNEIISLRRQLRGEDKPREFNYDELVEQVAKESSGKIFHTTPGGGIEGVPVELVEGAKKQADRKLRILRFVGYLEHNQPGWREYFQKDMPNREKSFQATLSEAKKQGYDFDDMTLEDLRRRTIKDVDWTEAMNLFGILTIRSMVKRFDYMDGRMDPLSRELYAAEQTGDIIDAMLGSTFGAKIGDIMVGSASFMAEIATLGPLIGAPVKGASLLQKLGFFAKAAAARTAFKVPATAARAAQEYYIPTIARDGDGYVLDYEVGDRAAWELFVKHGAQEYIEQFSEFALRPLAGLAGQALNKTPLPRLGQNILSNPRLSSGVLAGIGRSLRSAGAGAERLRRAAGIGGIPEEMGEEYFSELLQFGATALGDITGLNALSDIGNTGPWNMTPEEHLLTAAGVGILGGVVSAPGYTLRKAGEVMERRAFRRVSDGLYGAVRADVEAGSPLSMIRDMLGDIPLNVPGRKLAALFQSEPKIQTALNFTDNQLALLNDAVENNGDMELSYGEVALRLDDKNDYDKIVAISSSKPGGMSVTEAESGVEKNIEPEVIAAAREKITTENSYAARLDEFRGVLAASHMPKKQQQGGIELFDAMTRSLAERSGLTPLEFIDDLQLRNISILDFINGNQELDPDKRAAYDPDSNVISLFDAADLSSFAHEVMHYFDHSLRHMRDRGWIAEPQLLQDIAVIDTYSATDGGGRDYERIAVAFENYLRHGKSPDAGLNKLFKLIKRIMMRIYAAVSPEYFAGAPLTAEISEVFDRMLSTERRMNTEFAEGDLLKIWREMDLLGLTAADRANFKAGAQLRKEQIADEVDAEKAKRWSILKRYAGSEAKTLMNAMPVYGVYRELDSTGKIAADAVLPLYGREVLNKLRAKGVIAKKPRPERSGEEFHDPQHRRDRAIGRSRYNEAYENYLFENYYVIWIMRSNNYPKIIPDAKFGVLKEQLGTFMASKDGMPSDLAARELSGFMGYEIEEQDLVDLLTDLKASDLRGKFNKAYQADKEYWNTQAENDLRLSATDDLNKLAADTGYESHGKMIEDILNNPRPNEFVNNHIRGRLAEFEAEFPVGEYMAAADAAIAQTDLLLGVLAGAVGIPDYKTSRDAFAAQEAAKVELMSVRDLKRSDLTLGAVKRNLRDAATAVRKGDAGTAYDAAQLARRQMELLRLMHRAQKDVFDMERHAARAARIKPRKDGKSPVQGDILFHIQKLAADYGLTDRAPTVPAGMELDKLLEALGSDIRHDDLPEINRDRDGAADYGGMRLADFRILADIMGSLEEHGRALVRNADAAKKDTTAQIKAEMIDTLNKLPEKHQYDENMLDRAKLRLQAATAQFRNLTGIIREADGMVNALGRNDGGVFERKTLDRLLRDPQTFKSSIIREAYEKFKESDAYLSKRMLELPKTMLGGDMPPLPAKINYRRGWDAIMITAFALNWGAETNRRKLLEGYDMTEEEGMRVLSVFDRAEDWTAIQGMWDVFDVILPHVNKAYYESNYIRMEEKPRAPFSVRLADGSTADVRGGYYPVRYDRRIDLKEYNDHDLQLEVGGDSMTVRSPAGGFSKKEMKYTGRPVLLTSLNPFYEGIEDHAHYAAFKVPARELAATFNDEKLKGALNLHLGRAKTAVLYDTIKTIINPQKPSGEQFVRAARSAAVAAALWGNPGSGLMQLTSASVGITTIGAKDYFDGAAAFWKNPFKNRDAINEMSSYMNDRYHGADKAITKEVAKLGDGKAKRAYGMLKNGGFLHIRTFDGAVSYPMWMAAYNHALNDGKTETDAIRFADKLIDESQGSGSTLATTAIARDRGLMGFTAMFFSAVSAYQNRVISAHKGFRAGTVTLNEMAMFYAAELALPSLLSGLLLGVARGSIGDLFGGGDDEKAQEYAARLFLVELMTYPIQGIPLLRELPDMAFGHGRGRDVTVPVMRPISLILTSAGNSIKALGELNSDDIDDERSREIMTRAAGGVAEAVSVWYKIPAVTAYKRIKRAIDRAFEEE